MTDLNPGELLMVGFEGTILNDLLRRYVMEWRLGGVILFSRNIHNPDQLAQLCDDLGNARREVADDPLLIAVDQEGGTVARLQEGVTIFPGNLALGSRGSAEDAFLQGKIIGRDLRTYGINMNLAPVLDLYSPLGSHSLGLRSLGSDPESVARLGTALIKGMQDEGVAATAKHFPGKGKARRDSHEELPVIEEDARGLRRRDIRPFKAAVDAGVKAIMTSHAAYPVLDNGAILPATLSGRIMTGLLRDELHFRGVLISDDLGMGALRGDYETGNAALRALMAGVDMLLLCHSPHDRERVFAVLTKMEKNDRVIKDRMIESTGRIAALKAELCSSCPSSLPESPGGEELPVRIARSAVSGRGAYRGMLPLEKGSRILLIWPLPVRTVQVENADQETIGPVEYFQSEEMVPEVLAVPLQPTAADRAAILERADEEQFLVVASYDAYRHPEQQELINAVLSRRPDTILVVVRDPRDANIFPRARTIIITRGYTGPSLRALAEVFSGKFKPEREE